MSDEREGGTPLKRTFLVWSWIGLLAAYVYTTVSFASLILAAGFATRLSSTMGRGHSADPGQRLIGILGVAVPLVVLLLACLVFLRYSVATYRMTVLDPPDEKDAQELLPLFRGSLAWLIAVWITVLAVRALPIILNLPLGT